MELTVESDALLEILMDFYCVTGVRVSLYAGDRRKLLSYPRQSHPFCALMHRPETGGACAASNDRAFAECVRTRKPLIYLCHAGLTEVMVPLIDDGSILGYVIFGQITTQSDPAALLDTLQAAARRYGLPEADCPACLPAIPRRTPAEVRAMARLLEACAYYMIYNDHIRLRQNGFAQNLNDYLQQHLEEKLTVERLCRVFGMGRTAFYRQVQATLHTGVHQHIHRLRLAQARALLAQTELSLDEVAARTGLGEASYFCRVFKRQAGCTPLQYRRRFRG